MGNNVTVGYLEYYSNLKIKNYNNNADGSVYELKIVRQDNMVKELS